ncbi:MAG: hypothetical protein RJB55_413, partial [Verrucomicrobiota bacterium]
VKLSGCFAAKLASRAVSREVPQTLTPSARSISAKARPSPVLAPVTNAVR